jgi:hypothetical protein
MSLPRLDQSALRDLTGIETLEVKTSGPVRKDENGQDYLPKQHLFFEVPEDSVGSPWIAEPTENSAHLNNDLDYNWKSVAWLRAPDRAGPEKDILFLRFDVAEPLMQLLKTKGRPAEDSIVGWLLVEHKIAYVVLVNLDLHKEPQTELDLLTKTPE